MDKPTIAVVIPIFNDWDSLSVLLPRLNEVLGARGWSGEVVLIDDGSVVPVPDELRRSVPFTHIPHIEIVRLLRNLGHQRAIAVGLTHVQKSSSHVTAIAVMDGDGEDRPEDVPLLVDRLKQQSRASVVFAARTKRLEHWTFQVMYKLYKFVHWLLTGVSVKTGNFSVLLPEALPKLVVVSELWNHYAAAVFRSRIAFEVLPLARGRRYRGQSQMNFTSLVLHGLSAISVFSDIVGIRLLVASLVVMVAAGSLLFAVIFLRFMTPLAIPGWATNAAGLLVVVLVQSLLLMLVLSFIILSMRSHINVIPSRDASVFIGEVEKLG